MNRASHSHEQTLVSYIETDIDCSICLEDARQALVALDDVEEVKVDSAVGCFVVEHSSETDRLVEVITRLGHRLVEAGNGELGMGRATAEPVASCAHHPHSPTEPKAP